MTTVGMLSLRSPEGKTGAQPWQEAMAEPTRFKGCGCERVSREGEQQVTHNRCSLWANAREFVKKIDLKRGLTVLPRVGGHGQI